jgi:hypothetical protein
VSCAALLLTTENLAQLNDVSNRNTAIIEVEPGLALLVEYVRIVVATLSTSLVYKTRKELIDERPISLVLVHEAHVLLVNSPQCLIP